MQTCSWHRIRINRLRARNRGFSSIIGAIFMVITMWILASTFFIWTLSQNTAYNVAIREKNQLESDVQSEDVQVTSTTYVVNANNKVNVSTTINNIGSLSVQFTTLWAYANNATYTCNNFTALSNVNVRGGATMPLSVNVTVQGLSLTGTYSFASWLITSRGNVVPLQKTTSTNLIVANTTQGIGSVAFDFEQFWHNDFLSTPSQGTALPSASSMNYTISSSNYTVYHVVLTDLDPLGQVIVLNGNSSIYIIGQHSGTVKYSTWNLVNVTNGKIYPSSNVQYMLSYGVSTAIYFAGSISGIDTNNPYPLNILLCGKKGNNDYGQNIPFVAIYLVP